jgi:hypothetical protein
MYFWVSCDPQNHFINCSVFSCWVFTARYKLNIYTKLTRTSCCSSPVPLQFYAAAPLFPFNFMQQLSCSPSILCSSSPVPLQFYTAAPLFPFNLMLQLPCSPSILCCSSPVPLQFYAATPLFPFNFMLQLLCSPSI